MYNRAIKLLLNGLVVRFGSSLSFLNGSEVGLVWLEPYQTGLGIGLVQFKFWKLLKRVNLNWFDFEKAKPIKPKPNRCRFLLIPIRVLGIIIHHV